MPQATKRILGAQLWINLAAKDKMCPPAYGDIKSENVPVLEEEKARIHIISGNYRGVKGAFAAKYVQATYLDVELDANSSWELTVPKADTLFIYIVSGEGKFSDEKVSEKSAVLFSEGEEFRIETLETPIRFLLFCAAPLKEPIAWGGPIVMNTKAELDQAFKDLDRGTFIKH